MTGLKRLFWLGAGLLALGLGILGAFLPVLPTTPFVLLAAYCFARSSPRLHLWLMTHRTFGPNIRNWQAHGAISRRAKRLAAATMVAAFLLSVFLRLPLWVLVVQALALGGAAAFVLSRPDPPGDH
jgi:uncharacterized membrane protein YbaN (DUF454 family)